MNKVLINAIKRERKQATMDAAKACVVWMALALREEGYGAERIARVLKAVHKYSQTVVGGIAIEEQLEHIRNVTGLVINWNDNEMTIEGLEEWENYE